MPQARRPTVFIGSSKEGLPYGNAVFSELEAEAEPSVWDQSIFAPTKGTLEELERLAHTFDFAVLVLTPDDQRHSRGQTADVPRDNLIAELGLFIGTLGRERVFFLKPRGSSIALPTDFLGVTALQYAIRQDENYRAAVRTASTEIVKAIRQKGSVTRVLTPSLRVDLIVPASQDENHARTDLCVYLPEEITALRVSRRPLIQEAGLPGPLWMTITPYISTAFPYVEKMNVLETVNLAIPQLRGETLFSFENLIYPRQAEGITQAYKYFAQVVSLEVL